MKIRQLEAFRATVINGTISAAAKYMRTTQPTVSRMLIQLERDLGITLFRREKGRLHLTNEGMQFYQSVDEVFASLSGLNDTTERLRNNAFLEIRIFSTPAISMTIIPELMARLVAEHPEMRAKLITLDYYSYFAAHCETEHDIVLGHRVGFEANMEQTTLAEVDFVCVLPPGHPLTGQEIVHVEDLAGETIISLLDDRHRVFLRHEKLFQEADVAVNQRIFCHSSAATYAMVQRGLGVAIMEPFSAPMFEPFGVVVRPFRPRLTYDFIAGLKHVELQSVAMSQVIGLAREILEVYSPVVLQSETDRG
ncbi:LysR substrate-binding domain-containing protein [Pararhizobium sp. IMCC21322]|uniref:LysR substrate-binding domain-containing protein n=1 Tax=Pararhizobium sp. IMCC21322 TaxID=3067903 RepID=UPI002741B5C3|nr:LysR substrate-binding domain-containing protein [Pararhizobium sp. IMCC21322]